MKADSKVLDGRTALVFGASAGIGEAAAYALAEAGCYVAVAARRGSECERVAHHIRANGGGALAHACDVADYGAVERTVAAIDRERAQLNILVNCAGVIQPIARLEDSDPAAWGASVGINLIGVYNGLRATMGRFREAGAGVVVNVGSGAAEVAMEGWSAYCAAKAAVAMLSKCYAEETRGTGIRVYDFRPGVVDTQMQVEVRASGINPLSKRPRGQLAPASEPARALVWLCTDDAASFSGKFVDIRDPEVRRRSGLPVPVALKA